MRALPMIGLVLGLLIFVLLILWQGVGDIFDLLATSGWELLTLPIVWAPCLLAAAYSWRMLFPKQHTPEFGKVLKALWIGRAINTLLPVASIGGEIAKARLITTGMAHRTAFKLYYAPQNYYIHSQTYLCAHFQ